MCLRAAKTFFATHADPAARRTQSALSSPEDCPGMGALSEVGLRFNSPDARSMFNMPDPKPRIRPMMKPHGDEPAKLSSIQPRKPPASTPAMNSADKRKACPRPLASEALRLAAFADCSRPDENFAQPGTETLEPRGQFGFVTGFRIFLIIPGPLRINHGQTVEVGNDRKKTGPVSRAHHICGAITVSRIAAIL